MPAQKATSLSDIMRGGDIPYYPIEIPGLLVGNKPALFYFKPLSLKDAKAFNADRAKDPEGEKVDERILDLVSKYVVNEKGERIFNTEESIKWLMEEVSVEIYNVLATALFESLSGVMGKKKDSEVDKREQTAYEKATEEVIAKSAADNDTLNPTSITSANDTSGIVDDPM